jgi:hypothetical protein
VGEKERERQAEEDLELSEQDAEGVKGGYIPIGDGGKTDARQVTKAHRKKGKHQKHK